MQTNTLISGDGKLEESPETKAIRAALGAITMGEPAIYHLHADARGHWHVHRDGQLSRLSFPSRDLALAAARLAVVRCQAYCLLLQDADGCMGTESFNWLQSALDGEPPVPHSEFAACGRRPGN
jgi:hypothetical protein